MSLNYYISHFTNEIIKSTFTLSVEAKILILLFLIILSYITYKYIINNTLIPPKYVYWLFIFIGVNIIGVIVFSILYLKYKGSFRGDQGDKGIIGDKGDEGQNITCKICNFNIYLQKTNRYENKLKFSNNIFNLLFNQGYNFFNIRDHFIDNNINIDNFLSDLYNNKLKPEYNSIKNLIKISHYVLYYDIISIINTGSLEFVNSNLFIKKPGKKRGFFPTSDTIELSTSKKQAYLFSSDDMIYPRSFAKISEFSVDTEDVKETYVVYKLNPPANYKSLGVAILNKTNTTTEKNKQDLLKEYVCLNNNCLKLAKIQDLSLEFIYPDNEGGFITFWTSVFNTLHINNPKRDDIKNNFKLSEILKSYDASIYYDSGNVRRDIYKQLEDFYSNFKVSKLSSFCVILGHYYKQIKTDLFNLKNNYNDIINLRMINNVALNNIGNIMNIINNVENKIETEIKKAENKVNEELNAPIQNILNNDESNLLNRLINSKKSINTIKNYLNYIPSEIDNIESLNDLIKTLFINGYFTKIIKTNLTDEQINIILLCMSLLPPIAEEVYIPQNRCLVYNQIDETRLELINKAENYVDKYNKLIEDINNSFTGDYEEDKLKKINKQNQIALFKFNNELSNILNYIEKIQQKNFKEFTDNQLRLLNTEYEKIFNIL